MSVMVDDGHSLPYLDEMQRTRLTLRLSELPKEEQRRLRKATTHGTALALRDDRLMQYALLGQGRRMRVAFALIFPLNAAWQIGRVLSDGASTPRLLACCLLFVPPGLYFLWAWWRAHTLEKALGLTKESFR